MLALKILRMVAFEGNGCFVTIMLFLAYDDDWLISRIQISLSSKLCSELGQARTARRTHQFHTTPDYAGLTGSLQRE